VCRPGARCNIDTRVTLTKLREYCLSFPGATEQIQWGADLVFKVGGKMFCVACTEVAPNVMSFKCDDEMFAEMCERSGIVPAPYMARAKWIALERWDTLADSELKPLVADAYRLVKEKLPNRTQESLGAAAAASPSTRRAKRPKGRAIVRIAKTRKTRKTAKR
jgi:predicted DNA-binding protein (MmcQ/YjbR family)